MLLWLFLKRSFFIFDKATSFISTITSLFFSCPSLSVFIFSYTHLHTHTNARVLPPLLLLLPLFILNGAHNPILTCYAVFRVRSLESRNCWTRSEVSCASVSLRENTVEFKLGETSAVSIWKKERKSNTALVKVTYIIYTIHAPNHLKPKFVAFCSYCSPPDSDTSSGLILTLLQCQWKNVS